VTGREAIGWSALVPGPFVVLSIYLVLSRWPHRQFSAVADYGGLAVAITVGLVGTWMLVPSRPYKIVVSLIYVPFFCPALIYYGLIFVCAVFKDCL
jgi:hypothetical protein